MPLPKRNIGEPRDEFMERCMQDDIMKSEYPDARQRLAICAVQARSKYKTS